MNQPAQPSRHLLQGRTKKPHRYVPAAATDIRETFRKFRRAQALAHAAKGDAHA